MNKTKSLFVFLLVVMLVGGAAVLSAQEVVEAIVAVVNDDFISLSDYMTRLSNLYNLLRTQLQGEELDTQYEALKNNLMDTMITELLLLQEARNKGFDATEQLNAQIERMKEENGFTSDDQLIQALSQENISYDEWRESMRLGILQQMVLGSEVGRTLVVDDSELAGYYNQHLEDFRNPEEYTLKGIYVSSDGKSEEDVQAKKKAVDEKLAAGEDMSLVASEEGEGPEKDSSGDLGTFIRGEMLPVMEQAVEGLNAGDMTSWIEMPSGWYLLRLEDKKESEIKSFEDVRQEIEQILFNQKNEVAITKYLEELKARSYIKILIPDPENYKRNS